MSTTVHDACGGCSGCDGVPKPGAGQYIALSELPDVPPDKAESEARGDFSPPYRYPFLVGVYLAINAIPDAAVIVDGPDCLFFKAEIVHGKHDLNSTLLRNDGRHRVVASHVYTDNVAQSKGELVRQLLERTMKSSAYGAILVSALPMVSIIGTHYDQIMRDIGPQENVDLIEVPGRSLAADWLDGYSDTLVALAKNLRLAPAEMEADTVAVIGYFMDRTEQDHLGNVRELRRLVEAMGLKLATVWLGNESCADLGKVSEAATLLALPLGQGAAQHLAERTGAAVVEVDVPFGLGRTSRFLRALGDATGRREQAEALIESELRRVIPRIEWLVPHTFLGAQIGFSGSPDLWPGFLQLATDLGMEVVHLSAPCLRPRWLADLSGFEPLPPLFLDVSFMEIQRELRRMKHNRIDLLIASSGMRCHGPKAVAKMEFGFPSNNHHVIHDEPYLGFDGFLRFVQRMANAIEKHRESLRHQGPT